MPIPNPSNAPLAVTETEEIKNPRQIRRNACVPAATVSGFVVNSCISCFANRRQPNVPTAIMTAHITSVSSNSLRTRFISFAP